MLKKIFLILLFSLTIFLMLIIKNKYAHPISKIHFDGKDEFILNRVYRDEKNTYSALFSSKQRFLRVNIYKDISSTDAHTKIQSIITGLKGLYADAYSPYPGEITEIIHCPNTLVPVFNEKTINNLKIFTITGTLNNRLVWGNCTESEAIYTVEMMLFFCENKKNMFQLEYIIPIQQLPENNDKFISYEESIRCL